MQNSYKKQYCLLQEQIQLIKITNSIFKKLSAPFFLIVSFLLLTNNSFSQKLKLNESEYFETSGLNVFVFSNEYNGFFYDEKTAGIELIHHGVRTGTNGAVRLRSTPEQWDLVPKVVERKVDIENNSIDVVLRYDEYDFNSRVSVTAKDDGVVISVYLDKSLPEKLEGHAGFNLEFLPSAYFEKTYLMDNSPGIFPLYPSGPTVVKPNTYKITLFAGHTTFDDRGRDEFVDPLPIEINLAQNFPNPFNPTTTISFSLPQNSNVHLVLFNLLGKEVKNIVDGLYPAGTHSVKLNAENLSSGVYFYKLETGNYAATKKLVIMK